jgi:glutamyl-Q tRNA(Asp) synthetase
LQKIFRFAPSPNGRLHLGHAYSALCNERAARASGGALLLRIEDTDPTRSKRAFEDAIVEDLDWLGVLFDGAPRRQSDHLDDYARAFERLAARGLLYPCFCTRGKILADNGGARDPDGGPLHLRRCEDAGTTGETPAWRLDTRRAVAEVSKPLYWSEFREGEEEARIEAAPLAWGDFMLRGKERAATYHLAVVVDDALQGVTDVVRGRDIFPATSIHVLLQALLNLDSPRYHHHRLVLDAAGSKMSKSAASQPIAALREAGYSPEDLRAALGFGGRARLELEATLS